ncbi:GNAT family N-acetyltransferase [Streptomyces apocyni]|uniref:GNAT family N-acetyltransferase n=1 Tax=Streptomyces apocyni TaxID=2654677 RepID=UPI0012EA473A|nr:GNAT family N-acetyltransferase [Streptomyces apocyni]
MGVTIRRAAERDRESLVRLLDEAFTDDPVSSWVFPDVARRREVHGVFMGVFLDIALREGRVDIADEGAAVALWLRVPAGAPDEEDDTPVRMREAADPDNERAELVGRLTGAVHPHDREHEYLMLIAADPGRQGEGLGTALLAPVLERCDQDGVPAYLEASNMRSRQLYERLGFAFTGRAVQLPDGPQMFPMWREPKGR